MPHVAKQQINSGWGTFAAGHEVSGVPDEALAAWTAAGVVEHVGDDPGESEERPVETAVAEAPEKRPQVRNAPPKKVSGKS